MTKKLIIFCFIGFALQTTVAQQIKPSIVTWGFRYPFEELCKVVQENGVSMLELLSPDKWERARQNGCEILLANGADLGVERAFCNPDFHKKLQERYVEIIPKAAKNEIKMLICYSGIRPDFSSEQALENCVAGLKPVVECAEKHGVTIVMELISSNLSKSTWWQHTYPHYACDNIAWGAALADRLNSPNFKLIYDVWQMNDMSADVIADIQQYGKYIAHYHIAGKDRGIIKADDSIDYQAIIGAIRATGYTGYIGLEFLTERQIPESIRFGVSLINKN